MNVWLARCLYSMCEFFRIAGCRLRVHGYRLAGGRDIDGKCLFGRGVRIERPWRVTIGTRCSLQPGVWINVVDDHARLVVGAYTFMGRGVEVDVKQHVAIGRGCLIAPGVFVTDHNHGMRLGPPMFEQACVAEETKIGDDVWIGANAVILPGATIGDGAVVAAGAVVRGEVPARAVVGGVPARIIRYRE